MNVSISKAANFIKTYIAANVPCNLIGSPGLGKSDIIKQVAKDLNLKVIDFRLSTADPTDLSGMPFVENGRSVYLPNVAFPIVGDELPHHLDAEGQPVKVPVLDAQGKQEVDANGQAVFHYPKYDGWLLFLDEITNAPMSVQAAAYKIILDREVGLHELHPAVKICCAGNKITDNAAVSGDMSTALKSRLAHMNLELNIKDWLNWALTTGIHHSITSFIEFKPTCLHNFDPKVKTDTFACPRTWAMANRIVEQVGLNEPNLQSMLSGVLGDGAAVEYMNFTKNFVGLTTFEQVCADPHNAKIPEGNISAMFALAGSIAAQVDTDTMDKVVPFMERMPKEYQLSTFTSFTKRKPTLVVHPALRNWLQVNSPEMTRA